jgi:hypothetical protein
MERLDAGLWPIWLRERLPLIPIPLRAPHEDARPDLQGVPHQICDAAGYEDDIYQGQPQPRLSPRTLPGRSRSYRPGPEPFAVVVGPSPELAGVRISPSKTVVSLSVVLLHQAGRSRPAGMPGLSI